MVHNRRFLVKPRMHLTLLAFHALLIVQASAHGMMLTPKIRLKPGDAGNGFDYSRAPNKAPCANLPPGSATNIKSGPGVLTYAITAHHKGGCVVYLSKGGEGPWTDDKIIGRDANCGTTGNSININVPEGAYSGVMRWHWVTDNGSGEEYNNCADVNVSSFGASGNTSVPSRAPQPPIPSPTSPSPQRNPSTPGTPCRTPGAFLQPLPAGTTCVDVKHECQSLCIRKQQYNIERNQCFGETGANAMQWCACNGVTYYDVASGAATTACPSGNGASSPPPAPPAPVPAPAPVPDTPKPQPPMPAPQPNTPAQGGGASCTEDGQYSCTTDGRMTVCAQNNWIPISCPPGSKCTPLQGSVYCM
ncbi:hypothetical protein BC830DRAFT_1154534 [Chytriomyces sp. MP71]|nr:hypothetical protein BC830DRAFT_1154534 [Chytriomyces sp. MP71]